MKIHAQPGLDVPCIPEIAAARSPENAPVNDAVEKKMEILQAVEFYQ